LAQWVQYALLTDANHWSAVDKLAFADILGEAAWTVTHNCSLQASSS